MRGLLLKDFYTITKQMKFFLLFIVFFCLIPTFNGTSFAIVYASMLPMTAVAYDEHSKWNQLACTMPYKKSNLVVSKYLLGYILLAVVCAFAYICQTVISILKGSSISTENIVAILVSLCVGLILISIMLPALFKFGVEKGRILIMIFAAITVASVVYLQNKIIPVAELIASNGFIMVAGLIVSTVLLNLISIFLSLAIDGHKNN